MTGKFTDEEQQYIERLMVWKKQDRKRRLIFYISCLIAAGLIILFTFLYLFQNPAHHSIYVIGIPGILTAVPLIVVVILGLKSIDEKTLIAAIFSKVKHKK